jgi:hypothetical protein
MVQVASAATCVCLRGWWAEVSAASQQSVVWLRPRWTARSVPATCIKIQRYASGSLKTWACTSPPFCAPGSEVVAFLSQAGSAGAILINDASAGFVARSPIDSRKGGNHGSDGHLVIHSASEYATCSAIRCAI